MIKLITLNFINVIIIDLILNFIELNSKTTINFNCNVDIKK